MALRPRNTPNTASKTCTVLAVAVVLSAFMAAPAQAYIGPGAGFAVLSSFFVVLLATFSAGLALLTWPVRRIIRSIRGRRAMARARIKRVVVVGLDGMDPDLVDGFFQRKLLPNLQKLATKGTYSRLGTTAPPISPVAWSSFLTGCNPGKHNIFDFLIHDRRTYAPKLSSVYIGGARRSLRIGKFRLPIGRPNIRLLRKGKPFWNWLGSHGIFSTVLRVPITFPPEKFNGLLLSAMCIPDLRGSQGTFSYYTTATEGESNHTGGERIQVSCRDGHIDARLVGPRNTLLDGSPPVEIPFAIDLNGGNDSATLTIADKKIDLQIDQYTDWVEVTFRLGMGIKVSGICKFLLLATRPEFSLYVTPIQINPERPAMPITHPPAYSVYLSKKQGLFATLGLAEDTWALNEQILDDTSFLQQCLDTDSEREVMFFDSLEKLKQGLSVVVFDGTDRIQHMFWRYIDKGHPARDCTGTPQLPNAIEEHYLRCDKLVEKVMKQCDDDDTLLLVISDHGFKSFRRGVDLNRWLVDNGYMTLKPDASGEKYLRDVDWSQTRAFALGLAGIYLNIRDREAQGIVAPGSEANALRKELCAKLTGLADDTMGEKAINRALNAHKTYHGPYSKDGPDVLVGYNVGYRVSWETAVGQITEHVFHDNVKAWSGDHCIDPKLVPGVLFSNRKIRVDGPRLLDVGPTVLDLFGVSVPKTMDGKPWSVADAKGRFRRKSKTGS